MALHRLLVFVPHAASVADLELGLCRDTQPSEFAAYLYALDLRDDWQTCVSVLTYMRQRGIPQTSDHFALAIGVCSRARQLQMVQSMFSDARAASQADLGVWISVLVAYNRAGAPWFTRGDVLEWLTTVGGGGGKPPRPPPPLSWTQISSLETMRLQKETLIWAIFVPQISGLQTPYPLPPLV